MPLIGRWSELTWGLRKLITGIRPYAPFTYRGLVEFRILAEDALYTLGGDLITRQEAAHQLIYDLLVELAEHQNLSNNLEDLVALELD